MASFDYFIDPLYNDFRVINGELALTRGSKTVEQQVRIALGIELGEWYLNLNEGAPYYSRDGNVNSNEDVGILGGNFELSEVAAVLRSVILLVTGVIEIVTSSIAADPLKENGFTFKASILVETGSVNAIGTQDSAIINVTV